MINSSIKFNGKNRHKSLMNLEMKINKSSDAILDEYCSIPFDYLSYSEALMKDNRTICDFLIDKLKEKQIFVYTFCNKDNTISISTKIIYLFLNIDLCFVINGFYINEKYISHVFYNTTNDTLITMIIRTKYRILYNIIVCLAIKYLFGCFFKEEDRLKCIFASEKNDIEELKKRVCNFINSMKRTNIIFIIFSFVVMIFSFFYISCFNIVYPYIKSEWIITGCLSFGIVQIIAIVLPFCSALIRQIGIEFKSEKLFKLSQLL